MTHGDLSPEELERMGIGPGLIRMSVGVEHYEDIIADLEQALAAVEVPPEKERAARRGAARAAAGHH